MSVYCHVYPLTVEGRNGFMAPAIACGWKTKFTA